MATPDTKHQPLQTATHPVSLASYTRTPRDVLGELMWGKGIRRASKSVGCQLVAVSGVIESP